MAYLVKFQRDGAQVLRSELFETFREAHAFAAANQERLAADVIVITELDDDGMEVRDHEIQKHT